MMGQPAAQGAALSPWVETMLEVIPRTLAMVLAGGKGERLYPLTEIRAKPAVPFAGMFRLVDFVLSNLVNSGIQSIYVLTQYRAQSLLRHLQVGWLATSPLNNFLILAVPAQMRLGESWYQGTADAVYQNAYLIQQTKPPLVLVFGADHVYFMDVRQMIQFHLEADAEVTVATIPFPIAECSRFGVVVVDDTFRIKSFEEKVEHPTPMPDRPDLGLVSMGNYVFSSDVLLEELAADAEQPESSHDFGKDILPRICQSRRVYAYDFTTNRIPGVDGPNTYWRDVGTVQAYYDANMDLKNPMPALNLYNPRWPARSVRHQEPAAKIVVDMHGRPGTIENSLIGAGSVVSGGSVRDSVVGRNVFIESGAQVEQSVILGHAVIREGARVRRAIIDHGQVIPQYSTLGHDREHDRQHYHVDESGIVLTGPGSWEDDLLVR